MMYSYFETMRRFRFSLFLVSLFVFLIVYPLLHYKFQGQIAIVEFIFMLLAMTGLNLLMHTKKALKIAAFLSVCIFFEILFSGYTNNQMLLSITIITELCFFVIIFISILNYVYAQQTIKINKLLAIVTSYLVLGILFALIYTLIFTFAPSSFQYTIGNGLSELKQFPHPRFFSEALYFSFVTLSTLGYGDWVPIFGALKMLSALEAIIGQLFIAMLIARLVGIHISQSVAKRGERHD